MVLQNFDLLRVQELARKCLKSKDAFRRAAEAVRLFRLQAELMGFSDQRHDFAIELDRVLLECGLEVRGVSRHESGDRSQPASAFVPQVEELRTCRQIERELVNNYNAVRTGLVPVKLAGILDRQRNACHQCANRLNEMIEEMTADKSSRSAVG